MRASVLLGLSVYIALTTVPSVSQDASDGVVHNRIEGIEVPSLANAPFTAKIVVTWNQPLVGGGTVSRKYYTLVARDSQGRVRRESREFVPANSSAEPLLRTFTILDPVSSTRTTCTRASMTCATSAFYARPLLTENAGGNGESLGQQTMDDLPVTGTRQTVSNVSGGGNRLAVSQTDTWYSPDLHMDISVTRSDPQSGEVILKVTNLVRGEPDSSWFTIPSGYAVKGGAIQ